jgi:hypothetical protein
MCSLHKGDDFAYPIARGEFDHLLLQPQSYYASNSPDVHVSKHGAPKKTRLSQKSKLF